MFDTCVPTGVSPICADSNVQRKHHAISTMPQRHGESWWSTLHLIHTRGVNTMPARKRDPRVQPEYYTVEEVSVVLKLGQTKVRELIRREHLPIVTYGRAIRVPIDKFVAWREERERRALLARSKESAN